MSAELIGILSVGVALAALHMASIKGLREDMNAKISDLREDMKRMEQRMSQLEQRMDALDQRMSRLEGVLDGLREALFERSRERVSE